MFEYTQRGSVCVIGAAGRLVAGAGAEPVHWPELTAHGVTTHVVVDLHRVTALDAAGVGTLLRLRAALVARGGRLTLLAPPPRVLRVLHLTGLTAGVGLVATHGAGPEAPWHAGCAATTLCRCA